MNLGKFYRRRGNKGEIQRKGRNSDVELSIGVNFRIGTIEHEGWFGFHCTSLIEAIVQKA